RHVRLYVIEKSGGLAGVDQRDNVGMGQLRGDADLTQKALGAECRGDFRPKDFDRDFAAVLFFFGQIHRRHAAPAELALDRVAIGERRCDGKRLRGGHGAKSYPVARATPPQRPSASISRIAPIVIPMSATLNVQNRTFDTPTSMKSTTPADERTRSMRLPNAPPATRATPITRNRSAGRVR